ncbi:hypothetical protein NSP_18090 [Nodularia spumigena CCY9414]|nr:hypothetical protein NSP_18090 [Nodularia spumigena CCY9414]
MGEAISGGLRLQLLFERRIPRIYAEEYVNSLLAQTRKGNGI